LPNQSLQKTLPWAWFIITLIVFVLDQWTKGLAAEHLQYAQPVAVFPGFNLTLHHNPGIAFSMFADGAASSRWILSAVAAVISIVIAVWIIRVGKKASIEVVGLALILGGALGNIYDRVLLGYVIDFIDWYVKDSHWPAFNIADSGVCVGAGLLIWDGLFGKKKKQQEAKA
jgi:signal peptidase II